MISENVLVFLLNKVDTAANTFVFQGYQNLAEHLTPTIFALIALSTMIFGYALVQGLASFSLQEISKRVLIIGFILAFALNWGIFSKYIYVLFTQAPDEIVSHLLPALGYGDNGNITTALQKAFYDGMYYIKVTWEIGSLHNPLPWFYALGMGIPLFFFIIYTLVELIIAKFGLAIYLVLAPITIPCFLFQKTKALIFDGWVKHLVIFAFIPIFVMSALALSLSLLMEISLSVKKAVDTNTLNLMSITVYQIYCLVGFSLIRKASYMAGSLAHGFATNGSSSLESAIITGFRAGGSLKNKLLGKNGTTSFSKRNSSDQNPNVQEAQCSRPNGWDCDTE